MIKAELKNSIKCNCDYSLFLSFEYNSNIISVIKNLPSRFWNNEQKTWEVPLNKLPYLLDNLSDQRFEITGEYVKLQEKKVVEVPGQYTFKTAPYNHQLEGIKFGLNHEKFLLGDEMGLGKTKQVIDLAMIKKIQKGYKHCLIICGVNGLKWNWKNEISTHSKEFGYILGTRNGKIGSNADKLEDLRLIAQNDHYFLITNIESLRDQEICDRIQYLCNNGEIGMVAFDECHKAKNPSSQQGKAILKIQAETMVAMTGTPLMNVPQDLYIILKWLGYEKHSFYSFRNHYCEMGGYGGYEIVGYKNLGELQERLKDIMLRRKKADILDLPEKTYIDEYVEMTAKQEKVYRGVQAELRAMIDQIELSSNPLSQLIRLRQATGYTGILSSTIQESAKLDRMEELVEEAVENGKQVVIFSNWTQMTDVIVERLKNYKIGVITGQTADMDRQTVVDCFQNGDYQVVVGTSGAMGTGITLTAGSVEIFMDEPWNMALKEQCVDRCHRIGQNSNLTVYTLMCRDTIDERIHDIVEKKGAMADALVDGKVSMNKKNFVEFLLS